MKLIILVAVCIKLLYARIPEGIFPKCSRYDPNLSQCILESVEKIRPVLAAGIKEIEFPSLEPFTMEKLNIDVKVPGFGLSGDALNIEVAGASDYHIKSFNLDVDKKMAQATLTFPVLEVEADYIIERSKMLLFNINSVGKFYGKFKDVKVVLNAKGDIESSNNDLDYLRIRTLAVKITIGRGSSMKVVPDSARFASKVAATLISMAPTKMLLTIIGPIINKAGAPIIKRYINNVLAEMPIQDILQD